MVAVLLCARRIYPLLLDDMLHRLHVPFHLLVTIELLLDEQYKQKQIARQNERQVVLLLCLPQKDPCGTLH